MVSCVLDSVGRVELEDEIDLEGGTACEERSRAFLEELDIKKVVKQAISSL